MWLFFCGGGWDVEFVCRVLGKGRGFGCYFGF